MDKRKIKGSLIASILMISVSIGNFSRLSGTENIRPIHIVTLLAGGAGIGILIMSVALMIRNKKD